MRGFAHFCAIVLLIPQALVLSAFTILDRLTAGRTLGRFFTNALAILDFLLGWRGLAVVVAVLIVMFAGFHRRSRPFAAAIVVVFAAFSTIALMTHAGLPRTFDEGLFYGPATLSGVVAGWTLYRDATSISTRLRPPSFAR